jgi:GrpB-like predicted nucleotidyltransferase (UPF0157 family)
VRTIVGPEYGTGQTVPHDASWCDLFEQERPVINEQIGRHVLDILHVDSRAGPGLDAKPIIDIAVLGNPDYIDR